ncbi:hypothetical protein [Pseudozobellia thermophila]|uniref:Uncharacterized protein n=1 Tax=Pseudozobellia thermophila TaxID=192903 RepID=A0A1M6KR32_9FLAO|nr:hypothetical protein [Pseudozobellia thermophila]SHJ61409.1 hypothetical protein SAMN04488513_106165 [Pseudozobellia thermophila]
MDITPPFVFQVDSDIVQDVYKHRDNFKIVVDETSKDCSTCAIYFSSNDIYYPNEEAVFKKRIVEKDAFEWYGTRIATAYKHIFIRDVFKQWYLEGINSDLNSIEKVAAFLRKETAGSKIITLGSSAGGFAAVLFGSLLYADRVLAFNAQFEVKTLLSTSSPSIDPILFRKKDTELFKYFDIKSMINGQVPIYYFYSNASEWDVKQYRHIKDVGTVCLIPFKTGHHGIPFIKNALPVVINLDDDKLRELSGRTHHPIVFSIKMIGLFEVIKGVYGQVRSRYLRRK